MAKTEHRQGAFDPDKMAENIQAILFGGYTCKDFSDITDEQMEAMYSLAYSLINQRSFERADKILTYLCGLDQYQAKYFIGIGICRQQMGRHKSAAQAYGAAALLDIENPIPPLRAAECFFALRQWKDARSGFEAALHWAGEQPRYADVRTRARLMLGALKTKDTSDG